MICRHANLLELIAHQPVPLAYALALLNASDNSSIIPAWLLYQYRAITQGYYICSERKIVTRIAAGTTRNVFRRWRGSGTTLAILALKSLVKKNRYHYSNSW